MRKGFTLIELLVVISIIALLSSVVLAQLNAAREKGRIAAGKQFSANAYHAAADQALGLWNLDETSGTVAFDSSGNGMNGGLNNFPATPWSSDAPLSGGRSLQFDGSNDYVQVPYDSSLAPTSAISFGAWFKTSSLSGGQKVIISKTETGGYQLSLNENGVCPVSTFCGLIHITGTYYTVSYPSANLSTDKWYYGFVTYDGETIKLYLDGKEMASNASPSGAITYSTTNPLCIGSEPNSSTCATGGYWNGYIDEVRIFGKALTASEVGALYARAAPRFALEGLK